MWYSQQRYPRAEMKACCELLSEFYLYVIFTARHPYLPAGKELWIAFRILSLCDIHSIIDRIRSSKEVVNCFQNFIFMWYSQLGSAAVAYRRGCELLSEFYLYVIFTAQSSVARPLAKLWIAFRILSLCDIHSSLGVNATTATVVNCFQNFIFMWYSQRWLIWLYNMWCCELLSEFYLYVIFTAIPSPNDWVSLFYDTS